MLKNCEVVRVLRMFGIPIMRLLASNGAPSRRQIAYTGTYWTLSLSKKEIRATPMTTAPASANAESEASPALIVK